MRKVLDKIKFFFKKSYNMLILLELIILIVLLFNSFVFKIAYTTEIALILLPFTVVSFFIFGYEKNNYRNKKDILMNVIIFILAYYFITYLLGMFVGFVRTAYSLALVDVIKNIFPLVLLILVSEILRYLLFTKSKGSAIATIIGVIVFVLIDVNAKVHLYDVFNYEGLTKMICLVVFPSITKNIFLTFLVRKSGYTNAIIYRLLTELNTYMLPIFPDFGEYISVLLKTVLPVFIMVRVNNMFIYFEERKIKDSRYNNRKMILYSVITFSLFGIVALTSGYFKYQALSIGSGSMSPKIQKGDVVIVKKVKDVSSIKKGDILVYNRDSKIIVHRVIKKFEVNGSYNFMTKGDNNNTKDAWVIKEGDVIGIVSLNIKYIGMPTVALNELLSR